MCCIMCNLISSHKQQNVLSQDNTLGLLLVAASCVTQPLYPLFRAQEKECGTTEMS